MWLNLPGSAQFLSPVRAAGLLEREMMHRRGRRRKERALRVIHKPDGFVKVQFCTSHPPPSSIKINNPWELLGHWQNIIQVRTRDKRRLVGNKMGCQGEGAISQVACDSGKTV